MKGREHTEQFVKTGEARTSGDDSDMLDPF